MQTPKPQAATGQPSAGTAGLPHSAPTVAGAARPASAQISRPTNISVPSNISSTYQPPNSGTNTPAASSTANTPTSTAVPQGSGSNSYPYPQANAVTTPSASYPYPRSNVSGAAGPGIASATSAAVAMASQYASATALRMVGQSDRNVPSQGHLFTDQLAREKAKAQMETMGVNKGVVEPKSMVVADHATEELVKRLLREVVRVKDHRVSCTHPRPPPFYPASDTPAGASSSASKQDPDAMQVDSDETRHDRIPMWKVEIIDDPAAAIARAHAEIEESEKAKKSSRVRERVEYDERKRTEEEERQRAIKQAAADAEAEKDGSDATRPREGSGSMEPDGLQRAGSETSGGMTAPATPGPGAAAASSPSALSTPSISSNTPVANPTTKKKSSKKNPQVDQDIQAKRLAEAQKQESNRALNMVLGRSSRKFSWMSGGGSGMGSPRTPSRASGLGGPLGSKYKRASMQDGKVTINSSSASPAPGTPGPAGSRPLGGVNGSHHLGKKRGHEDGSASPGGDASGMLKRAKTDLTSSSQPAQHRLPYIPPAPSPNILPADMLAVLSRQIRRGGPNRLLLEKQYQELLVSVAVKQWEEWKKENQGAGGSTIAGG